MDYVRTHTDITTYVHVLPLLLLLCISSFVLHWLCPTFNIIAEYIPTKIGNVYVYAIFSADGCRKFCNLPCDLPCTAVVFAWGIDAENYVYLLTCTVRICR